MKNTPAKIKKLRADAEQGDADAQYALGNAYWYGGGVDKDQRAAMRWYSKAAEQGRGGVVELSGGGLIGIATEQTA